MICKKGFTLWVFFAQVEIVLTRDSSLRKKSYFCLICTRNVEYKCSLFPKVMFSYQ
jgi:hypothetical protein